MHLVDGSKGADEVVQAPMLYVSAATLPKGASVEWQVTYATGRTHLLDEDDEPVVARRISRMMSTVCAFSQSLSSRSSRTDGAPTVLIGGLRVELSSKSDAAGEVLSIVAGSPGASTFLLLSLERS